MFLLMLYTHSMKILYHKIDTSAVILYYAQERVDTAPAILLYQIVIL